MWRAVPLVALMLIAGCGHNIGDPCQTNVDCNPQGDRFCDTASLHGYCTQENCDYSSCPGDSVCVRFFSPLQDEVCDPSSTPVAPLCSIDERCVCDDSENGKCVTAGPYATDMGPVVTDGGIPEVIGGHCAPSASEHRWCMKRCAHNGDCRDGYQCRETGTAGAEGLETFDMGNVNSKFCAPTGIDN